MNKYLVSWYIEVEASSPGEAACFAKEIQDQPANTATAFLVRQKPNLTDSYHLIDVGLDGQRATNSECYGLGMVARPLEGPGL